MGINILNMSLRKKTIMALLLLCSFATAALVIFKNNSDPAQIAQSQTFFDQFIIAGGPVVWFILLPMSFIATFLAASYCLTIRRKTLLPTNAFEYITELIQKGKINKLEYELTQNKDLISIAVLKAVTQSKGDWYRIKNALTDSLQDQAIKLMRKIEWLNLIGNVSPMVGLFGTVFGMIKLFNALVIAGGQPNPSHLAAGISIALVTTFWA